MTLGSLDIKNCSLEKRLTGKLVLECEDEILNTTETVLKDKKVKCIKNNCLVHMISLEFIWLLLLAVICVSCYLYFTDLHRNKDIYYHFKIPALN